MSELDKPCSHVIADVFFGEPLRKKTYIFTHHVVIEMYRL